MPILNHEEYTPCGVERALKIFDGKWKLLIIQRLFSGPLRTSQIEKSIPLAPQRALLKQLKELVDDGIIIKEVISDKPLHVCYSLSEKAEQLKPVLYALQKWSQDQHI